MWDDSWIVFWATLVVVPVCFALLVTLLCLHVRALWKDSQKENAKKIQRHGQQQQRHHHHHHHHHQRREDRAFRLPHLISLSASNTITERPRNNSGSMPTDWESWFRNLPIHRHLTKYGTVWTLLCFSVSAFLISSGRIHSAFKFKSENKPRCTSAIHTLSVCWGLSKTSTYLVFIARLQTVFRDSSYRYRSKTILLFYMSVISLFILASASLPWTMDGRLVRIHRSLTGRRIQSTEDGSTNDNNQVLLVCAMRMKMGGLLGFVGALSDLIFTGVFVAMFVFPLRRLAEAQERNELEPNQEQLKLLILPIKYCLTGTIATVSTLLSILVTGITGLILIVCVDFVVNALCLCLMTRYWDGLYWWLCSPLLRSLASGYPRLLDDQLKSHLSTILDSK